MDKSETKPKILIKIFFYSFLIQVVIPLALACRIGNLKPHAEATSISYKSPFQVAASLVEIKTDDGITVR